jgi:hypothetical protein
MSPLCYHTPEGSEADELEVANAAADNLYFRSCCGEIGDAAYIRCATWLDTVPGAGEYFRALCMREYTPKQKEEWAQFCFWRRECHEQLLHRGKGKGRVKVKDGPEAPSRKTLELEYSKGALPPVPWG